MTDNLNHCLMQNIFSHILEFSSRPMLIIKDASHRSSQKVSEYLTARYT